MTKPKTVQQLAQLRAKALELHTRGQIDAAVTAYTKYLKLNPRDGAALGLLAAAKLDQGYPAVALDLARKAYALAAGDPGLRYNYGRIAAEMREFAEAERMLASCLSVPEVADRAANSLGIVLLEAGRPAEAVEAFNGAIRRNPRAADYHLNIAMAFARLYQPDGAEAALRQAAELSPTDVEVRLLFARRLYENRKLVQAMAEYRAVLELAPETRGALSGLLMTKLRLCDWHRLDELKRQIGEIETARTSSDATHVSPYSITLTFDDPSRCFQAAKAAAPAMKQTLGTKPCLLRALHPTDKIRVAYVSADFREHATSYLVAELIELHDRKRFEIVGVSYGFNDASPMRTRMEKAFDRFVDVVDRSPGQIAAQMRAMNVDIAVDLQGFNQFNRMAIFAERAAPVQVIYLGWPGTSGAPYYDYIVADPIVVPPANQRWFSEQVAWLDGPYQPNDRRRVVASDIPSRTTVGLPERAFVYACFNNPFKITPETFASWMRILHAVPGSVLWLLDNGEAACRENIRRETEARGVDPSRVCFAPPLPNAQHLARHACMDVALDTLPYNAHTTASDALWMGVPVVTLTGASFAGRVATSLVTAAGCPELACATREAYESLAIALASDPQRLATLRERLGRARTESLLFDTPRLVRGLERAYRHMISRSASRQNPSSFRVSELAD